MKEKDHFSKDTIGMFDLIKGLAMLLIVLAHSFSQYSYKNFPLWVLILYQVTFTVLIPIFFMINGYGFRPQKMRQYLKKRTKHILKPYCYVAIVTTCIFVCVHYLNFHMKRAALEGGLSIFLGYIFGLRSGTKVSIGTIEIADCGPMWFLLAILLAGIILNTICQLKNKKVVFILVILTVFIGNILSRFGSWYYCMPITLVVVGYLYAGKLIKEYNLLWKKLPWWFYFGAIISWLIGTVFGGMDASTSYWKLGIFDTIFTVFAGILVLRGVLYLNHYRKGIFKLIRIIGRYSLWVVCIHTIECTSLPWYMFSSKFQNQPGIGTLLLWAAHCICILVGCLAIKALLLAKRKVKKRFLTKRSRN